MGLGFLSCHVFQVVHNHHCLVLSAIIIVVKCKQPFNAGSMQARCRLPSLLNAGSVQATIVDQCKFNVGNHYCLM